MYDLKFIITRITLCIKKHLKQKVLRYPSVKNMFNVQNISQL